jgi:hypothetical protein
MTTKSRAITITVVRIILYLVAAVALVVAAWGVDWRLGLAVIAVVLLLGEALISTRTGGAR